MFISYFIHLYSPFQKLSNKLPYFTFHYDIMTKYIMTLLEDSIVVLPCSCALAVGARLCSCWRRRHFGQLRWSGQQQLPPALQLAVEGVQMEIVQAKVRALADSNSLLPCAVLSCHVLYSDRAVLIEVRGATNQTLCKWREIAGDALFNLYFMRPSAFLIPCYVYNTETQRH